MLKTVRSAGACSRVIVVMLFMVLVLTGSV